MQSALTKRFLQATLRLRTGASRGNLKSVLLAQLKTLNAVPAMNFAENVQRDAPRDRKFEKIKNPDNINAKLFAATSINDLLTVTEQHIDTLKNDNIAITLRSLAKLLRNTANAQIDSLQKDTRYQALAAKAHEAIPTYSERDITDYIFWFRKFRGNRIPTYTNSESVSKLQGRVRELVNSKALNLKSIINIFFDFSILGLNSDELIKEIFAQIKADPKVLTPISAIQILQSCARKKSAAYNVEHNLAEFVQRQLNDFLPEYDSDQKSSIFKYLADLEMHINPPKYRTPMVLFTIKRQLTDSLEEISEAGIINIMEAYAKLPKDFSIDLLASIKQLMSDTLQHESKNVKSPFLIDFLEKNVELFKNRKAKSEELIPLFQEVAKRLPEDDYLGRVRTLERLIEIYDKAGAKIPELIDNIYAKIISFQSPLFSGPILECLHQNNKDITPILDKFIEANQLPRMGFFQKLRFYLIVTSIESDKYKDLKKNLKGELLADPQDTHKFISHISEVELKNPAVEELMEAAVASLKTKKGVSQDNLFYKDMFLSVTNDRKTQEGWIEWAKENLADIQEPELRKVTEAVFAMENLSTEKVFLYNAILLNAKPEIVPFQRLINGLKDNEQFLQILYRQEKNFVRFFNRILALMDTHKKDVRVQAIFSLVKRIESLYIKSPVIPPLAKKAYDIAQESNTKLSPQLELSIAQYLMENRHFSAEEAEKVYEKTKNLITSSTEHAKFMTYQLYSASPESLRSEETATKTSAQLEILNKQLTSNTRRSSLAALVSVLAFPARFLVKNQETYLKAFEKSLEEGNISTYFDLLSAIPTRFAKNDYGFYYPFIKQLIANYPKFQDKMTPGRVIDVLNSFVRLGTKNSYIYNLLLQDIATNFNRYKAEDLIEIIKAFTRLGINQSDLFDQTIQRKGTNLLNFQAKALLPNFFRVAYKSPVFQTAFVEALPTITSNPIILAAFIYYLPILELANEEELFQKFLPQLTQVTGRTENKRLYLTAYYLKNKYRNQPELAEALRDIIDDFEKVQNITNAKSYTQQKVTQTVTDYLKAMNVEFQTDFSIDGFGIDIYLPEQKKVVQLLLRSDLNFDKSTLTGKADLTKRIYQNFDGYESVIINTGEFEAIQEHAGRVSFLVESGIKDNVTGEHDFSHIQLTQRKRKQKRQPEEVAAAEEESSSDSESSHGEEASETSSEDEDEAEEVPVQNKP